MRFIFQAKLAKRVTPYIRGTPIPIAAKERELRQVAALRR
jgi:hypothetical protein